MPIFNPVDSRIPKSPSTVQLFPLWPRNILLQDLIDDHYNKLDVDGLKAAYMARAINIEQVSRVNGKMLDGPASVSGAVELLEQVTCVCSFMWLISRGQG